MSESPINLRGGVRSATARAATALIAGMVASVALAWAMPCWNEFDRQCGRTRWLAAHRGDDVWGLMLTRYRWHDGWRVSGERGVNVDAMNAGLARAGRPESDLIVRTDVGSLPSWLAEQMRDSTSDRFFRQAFGWPFRSMWSGFDGGTLSTLQIEVATPSPRVYVRTLPLTWFGSDKDVPTGVIWSGMAADSAIFACAWLLGATAVRTAWSRRRVPRGACPVCAYDLRHDLSSGCPECGWNKPSS